MSWIIKFFTSFYFVAFVLTWFTTNLIKASIRSYKKKEKFNLKYGFQNGGMPSSHSSVVTSIVTSVGLMDLLTKNEFSAIFYVSLVFALIIISDAFGMRQNMGKQGDAINAILKSKKLKLIEVVYGHTFFQVIMGILWGVCVTIATYYLFF